MTVSTLIRRFQVREKIREIASREPEQCRQATLPLWRNIVQEHVTSLVEWDDVVFALKSLWRSGRIFLTQPDCHHTHAVGYHGETDGWFYGRNINVIVRNESR
jgi:hypothetical protein